MVKKTWIHDVAIALSLVFLLRGAKVPLPSKGDRKEMSYASCHAKRRISVALLKGRLDCHSLFD
jgi:hypothetical protein